MLLTACLALLAVSCTPVKVDKSAVDRVNSLGFQLFNRLAGDSLTGNIVISPVCIEQGLALALNGARGATRAEIAQILGISESTSKSQYSRAKNKLKEMILKNQNYG